MSETEQKLLQVGDKIIRSQYSDESIIIIERVTEKQAFSGVHRFKREYADSGYISAIGSGKWAPSYWYGEKERVHLVRVKNIRKMLASGIGRRAEKLIEEDVLKINAILDGEQRPPRNTPPRNR